MFGAALGLAAYYWAVQIRAKRSKLSLFLTGLLSGFAFVAKLSYIPVMVPGIALLVLWGYQDEFMGKNDWKSVFKSFLSGSLIILVGLILALIPHLIKNGLLFHDPFFPFDAGGMGWLDQQWFGEAVTRRIILTYPLALTYGDYWAQSGNMSPLILAFLPLAFFLPRPKSFLSSPLFVISAVALLGVIIWMVSRPSVLAPRYIFATLFLLILLPARAAEYISLSDRQPHILAFGVIFFTALMLCSMGIFSLGRVFFPEATAKSLTGVIGECDRDGVPCLAMNEINKLAQPGERVLLASIQHYWFRGDLMQCLSNSDEWDDIKNASGTDLWLKLYGKGFSFLFIDKSTNAAFLERLNPENHPDWVKLTPVFNQSNVLVYHIEFTHPTTSIAPLTCQRQSSSKLWEVVVP
jgi:hypothetical protein